MRLATPPAEASAPRLVLTLLAFGLALSSCGGGDRDEGPRRFEPRSIHVSPYWDEAPDGTPTMTVRLALGLPFAGLDAPPEGCAVLPSEVVVTVNGTSAEMRHVGGSTANGDDLGCHTVAVAVAGGLPVEALDELTIRLQHDGPEATAVYKHLAIGAVAIPRGARLKVGDIAPLGLTNPLPEVVFVSLGQGVGSAAGVQDAMATRLLDGYAFRVRGTPGPATLFVRAGLPDFADGRTGATAICTGFSTCTSERTFVAGPVAVELVP